MKIFQPPHLLTHNKDKEYLALSWTHITQAVEIWVNALSFFPAFDTLLVMVRGGLVPATLLSHQLKIRQMKFLQGIRTASDTPFDYCSFSAILLPEIEKTEKILIVEDIIYKGETVNQAIKFVENKGGMIIGICTLVIDESFRDDINDNLSVISAYKCTAEKWIRFPWERPLQQEDPTTTKNTNK